MAKRKNPIPLGTLSVMLAMTMSQPALANTGADVTSRTGSLGTSAKYVYPLREAGQAAGRELWGYMSSATNWPTESYSYGFMAFNASSAFNFRDLLSDPNNQMRPNGGSSYRDGLYDFINYQTEGQTIKLTHYQYDTNGWHLVFAPELVSSRSLIATETATSKISGKVYGQFYTEEMLSFEIGEIDYETMTRTTIAPSYHKYVAMGVTSDEQLYAIATDGNLYHIDTTTGEEVKVGATGVYIAANSRESYGQSGEIDQDTNIFYWACIDGDKNAALYTVDLNTGWATKIADFPDNEQFYGLAIPDAAPEATAPAAPRNVSASFVNGATTGTIHLTAPTQTYGGTTLTGNVTYTIRTGTTVLTTGTIAAGASADVQVTAPEGMNYFSVFLSNEAGKSPLVKTSAYVGFDQPCAPTYTTLVIDEQTGKAKVTWNDPKKSVHGGYIAPLTYDVVRYPEGVRVAKGQTATSFTETLDANALHNYYYGVTAISGNVRSEESKTDMVRFGNNIEPPYLETFDTQGDFDLYTTIDNNNDGSTWTWHEERQCAQYFENEKNDADDWLVTPPVHLQANHAYKIGFQARNSMGFFPEYIEARYGNSATVSGLNTDFVEKTKLADEQYHKFEKEFSTSRDQVFYLGIHAVSDRGAAKIFVDSIQITDQGCLEGPDSVTQFTVTPDPQADILATIQFTLPTKKVNGGALTEITKVVVSRNGEVFKEFASPKVGATLSCVDEEADEEFNTYTVTAYNSAGNGRPATVRTFIGLDKPSKPSNVQGTYGANDLTLSWNKATTPGANGGLVLTDGVTYNVYHAVQVKDEQVEQLIATTSQPSHVLDFNNSTGAQAVEHYFIGAKNEKGESEHAAAPIVISGAPYTLPFHSSFTTEEGAPLWWTDETDEEGFSLNEHQSADGDNHCMLFTSYSFGDQAQFASGKIALGQAANPEIVFSHNATPGNDDVIEVFATTPSGKQVAVGSVDYKTISGKAEWRNIAFKIPAELTQEPFVIFTFKATATRYDIVKIDNVYVRDVYDHDLAVNISSPESAQRGAKVPVTVTVSNNGDQEATGYTLTVKGNDKVLFTQSYDETLAPLASKTINVEVTSDVNSQTSALNLVAELTYDADQKTDNNTASASIRLLDSEIPTPRDAAVTNNPQSNTINWSEPQTAEIAKTEDFEGYTNWIIDSFGDWTTYSSNKGSTTGGLFGTYGMPFEHEGEKYVYIVFNPEAVQEGITSANATIAPHGGDKCLMSMWSREGTTYLPNDDWLISPLLSGKAQTIELYVNNGQPSGSGVKYTSSFEVLYSTDTNAPDDFVTAEEYTQSSSKWGRYQVDLPDGANYFAIRNITDADNSYIFLVDDISYKAGFGQLKGYNIYRDGVLVKTVNAGTTSWEDDQIGDDLHRYAVSAVYVGGESAAVAAYDPTGISETTLQAKRTFDVYAVDGRCVAKGVTSLKGLPKGAYIINGKAHIVK